MMNMLANLDQNRIAAAMWERSADSAAPIVVCIDWLLDLTKELREDMTAVQMIKHDTVLELLGPYLKENPTNG